MTQMMREIKPEGYDDKWIPWKELPDEYRARWIAVHCSPDVCFEYGVNMLMHTTMITEEYWDALDKRCKFRKREDSPAERAAYTRKWYGGGSHDMRCPDCGQLVHEVGEVCYMQQQLWLEQDLELETGIAYPLEGFIPSKASMGIYALFALEERARRSAGLP